MRLIVVGPGRAGMSLALAAHAAEIEVVGLLGRGDVRDLAAQVDAAALTWGQPLPESDLVTLAVRDDAIAEVAASMAPSGDVPIVHMSGVAPLDILPGSRRGSFHPLQTLPDPIIGSRRLAGASVAIAGSDSIVLERLQQLAGLLGMRPFLVDEAMRPLYHAAAAAASNFVVTALAMAHRMFGAAGVDPAHAQPLTEAVVANVYELGPEAALTGPIARGDVGTVEAHLASISVHAPELLDGFRAMISETARLAGTSQLFQEIVS